MSAIKRFFEKKKLNSKFKLAGTGHQLNAPSSSKSTPTPLKTTERRPTKEAGAQAGNAALARFEASKSHASKMPTSSAATWKLKSDSECGTSKDMEQMKIIENQKSPPRPQVEDNVAFSCPLCPVSLPQHEIIEHLNNCLQDELDAEPLMISVTMIHTLNRNKQKVENGIKLLGKYIQNIIDNPDDPKYRKIRKTNKVFQEKVIILKGVEEFLCKGCGFEIQLMPFEINGENAEHEFYVMNETLAQDTEQLNAAKQMLADAEPLEICIDRNLKVFKPSATSSMHIEVPSSFYEMSTNEIKMKQANMTEQVEKSKQLRTKAMRDGETTPKRIYKYCIVRIRLPDGLIIQGTFSSVEKLDDLKKFVQECLALDWLPFSLVDSIGRPYSDDLATLTKLNLCPAALMNLNIESNIVEEVAASSPDRKMQYLRNEYLALIQSLP